MPHALPLGGVRGGHREITPLAAYLAAKPSCCHADPDPKAQLAAYALDVVFYGTIAGLATGAIRRVLRRRDAGIAAGVLQDVLDGDKGVPTLRKAKVWCPDFYGAITDVGEARGIAGLQEAIGRAEYVRGGQSFAAKIGTLVKRGALRAKLAVGDKKYREGRRALEASFAALVGVCDDLKKEVPADHRAFVDVLRTGYARERAAQASPLNPVGLGRKSISYVKGFGENACWYEPQESV